eukprot:gnl/TRDRNA2_/TRDRNA2_176502_c3_seq1.p1 gnl/TRDRNA2_/TRDRNA2_176502_c3~~gnl/TRDRNA2_/TRDRNA2_176502_c3_seq1.p1  ORF type:complete len:332 (-),score=61.35 gnl/TRDRNA2_/TRDRNA2_176502_c3_seq1:77-1027(-)
MTPDESNRYVGASLILEIQCINDWGGGITACDYQVDHIKGSAAKVGIMKGAEAIQDMQERRGFRFKVKMTGTMGLFSLPVLLNTLLTSFVMLSVVRFAVDFLMAWVLPQNKIYCTLKWEESVRFSDYRKHDEMAVRAVELHMSENSLKSGHEVDGPIGQAGTLAHLIHEGSMKLDGESFKQVDSSGALVHRARTSGRSDGSFLEVSPQQDKRAGSDVAAQWSSEGSLDPGLEELKTRLDALERGCCQPVQTNVVNLTLTSAAGNAPLLAQANEKSKDDGGGYHREVTAASDVSHNVPTERPVALEPVGEDCSMTWP